MSAKVYCVVEFPYYEPEKSIILHKTESKREALNFVLTIYTVHSLAHYIPELDKSARKLYIMIVALTNRIVSEWVNPAGVILPTTFHCMECNECFGIVIEEF